MKVAVVPLLLFATACSPPEVAPFHELDVNRDGRISEQEATLDAVLSERFPDADGDDNGELTALEYLQAADRR